MGGPASPFGDLAGDPQGIPLGYPPGDPLGEPWGDTLGAPLGVSPRGISQGESPRGIPQGGIPQRDPPGGSSWGIPRGISQADPPGGSPLGIPPRNPPGAKPWPRDPLVDPPGAQTGQPGSQANRAKLEQPGKVVSEWPDQFFGGSPEAERDMVVKTGIWNKNHSSLFARSGSST